MSAPTEQNPTCEIVSNSGYGSGDETSSLLVHTPSVTVITSGPSDKDSNGPSPAIKQHPSKPVLMRQDCTSKYLSTSQHPQLSGSGGLGGSEESQASIKIEESSTRSVPDIELHCRLDTSTGNIVVGDRQHVFTSPVISIPGACRHRSSVSGYQLIPQQSYSRCRTCERRASTTPLSSLHLARSVSRESVRSALHIPCACNHMHGGGTCSALQPPTVLLTTSSSNRIIRQSSQPEASAITCCAGHCVHQHHAPSASLRQLREPGDGIAGIAADSLRINGAMRQFRQVVIYVVQNNSKCSGLMC